MTRDVQRWLTHLTEVSGCLTRSLDLDTTLREIVRLPVPALADWCLVFIPDDGGPVPARLAVAHANPVKEALLQTVWQHEWVTLPETYPFVQAVRRRAPVVVNQLTQSDVERLCSTPEHASVLRRVGMDSLISLPLVAHGSILGAVMLVVAGARRGTFRHVPIETLAKLGECYAQAIYNSRQFIETRQEMRLKEELIALTRHELLELAAELSQYSLTVRREIERIAQRLEIALEPYGPA